LFTVEPEKRKTGEKQTTVFLLNRYEDAALILKKIRSKKTKVLRAFITLSYDQIGRKASE